MAGLLATMRRQMLRKKVSTHRRERTYRQVERTLDTTDLWGNLTPMTQEEEVEEPAVEYQIQEETGIEEEPESRVEEPAAPIYQSNLAGVVPIEEDTEEIQDDLLISRIDEFRDKAMQLQQMLTSRQSKVKELQLIVEEREDKAQELQQIVNERQRKADGITAEVTEKLDTLISRVTQKLDVVEQSLRDDLVSGNQVNSEHTQKLTSAIENVTKQIEAMDANFDEIAEDIDNISEKIHSENVKSYRNTVELFKELDDKLDKLDELENNVTNVRKYALGAFALSLVNLVAAIAFFVLSTMV